MPSFRHGGARAALTAGERLGDSLASVRRNEMKKLLTIVMATTTLVLAACNTVEGAGRDVQSAGRAIEDVGDR